MEMSPMVYITAIALSRMDTLDARNSLGEHIARDALITGFGIAAFLGWFEKLSGGPWLPISSAPKDGTIVKLLVQHVPSYDYTPLEDSLEPTQTIGFNAWEHTGVDGWQFVGWDWGHDHFCEGTGTVLSWKPF